MTIWNDLAKHQRATEARHILDLFDADPARALDFSIRASGMLFDYSKTNIDTTTRDLLVALAESSGLTDKRAAMFGGAAINETEGRAVLHVALRAGDDAVIRVGGADVLPEVRATRARAHAFAEDVRAGRFTGQGGPITDVVNIRALCQQRGRRAYRGHVARPEPGNDAGDRGVKDVHHN